MCRKQTVRGLCALFFGLGLVTGYALESWLLCCLGGSGLILGGMLLLGKR